MGGLLESSNQRGQHSRDAIKAALQLIGASDFDECTEARDLEERNALGRRASRNDEEVAAIGFGKASIAFGDVRRDRDRSAAQLVRKRLRTTREGVCQLADFNGDGDGKLIHLELLEEERHA
jgi:hypothetical protein